MFLEVYAVPLSDYNKETDDSIRPENKRLVEMTGARIRNSIKFADRAEIVMPCNEVLLAVGSYEELVQRLMSAQDGKIARV